MRFAVCMLAIICPLLAASNYADVPILSCSGLPCVEARLNGGPPLRLVLDFARCQSYVKKSALKGQTIGPVAEVRIGSATLTSRFVAVNPADQNSLSQIPRMSLPGGDGGLTLQAFADRLLVLTCRMGVFASAWRGRKPPVVRQIAES